ncbi:uncharacterized protein LOC135681672 [Rhopilema esculentum]|uniref:uncharacterized protein LOC135681672 n=1 Tax=Rhopilema esculentum TaxID=499914 RepID=UPI0031D822C5
MTNTNDREVISSKISNGKKDNFSSQRVSGQDWFYHAPRTNKDKSTKSSQAIPVSQIPGIGDLDNSPLDLGENIHLRRKWIRETDSKYVKLAKQGGRKDIFIYREHKPSSKGAVHYPRVDWFDHENQSIAHDQNSTEVEIPTTYKSAYPEWYIHELNEQNQRTQEQNTSIKKKQQILAFDDMSYWKREAVEQQERKVKSTPLKLPSLVKNKHSHTGMKNGSNIGSNFEQPYETKFPVISPKKKEEGSIGQLLSMQYQRDWLAEQDERKKMSEGRKRPHFRKLGTLIRILWGFNSVINKRTVVNIFIYREHKPSSKGAVHYPRVDWFDHENQSIAHDQNSTEVEIPTTYKSAYPEWYIHELNEQNQRTQEQNTSIKKKQQILAFDDMSYWKREAVEQQERKVKSTPLKLPSLVKNKHSHTGMKNGSNMASNFEQPYETKFPVISPKKKEEGSIGQLLSMQYQRDWLAEQDERKKMSEGRKFEMSEKEKEKSQRDQKYIKKMQDRNSQEERHLFKLSRFANVPAKTDSHRT